MRKLFIATGVILALLVGTSIQSFAEDDVIYGCVNKKGKLRIVSDPSECKEKETPIYWNVVGPPGPSAAIKVYDSSEPPQYLGIFLGVEATTWSTRSAAGVFITSLNKITYLSGHTGQIEEASLCFDSIHCTGQTYWDYYCVDVIFRLNGRYYVGERAAPTWWVLPSRFSKFEGCENGTFGGYYVPAIEILEEDIPFTLPVELPLHFEYDE